MAIYTKETSLFKTDAIKDDINNSRKVATDYITTITNDGIFVHQNDTNRDGDSPNDPTAYGVHISDDVDIIRGGQSVASYGDTARIGLENNSRIEISPTSLSAMNSDQVEGFRVDMMAPGMTSYVKVSSDKYSTRSPLTFSLDNYSSLALGEVLFGSSDIQIAWEIRPIGGSTISDLAAWIDRHVISASWVSSDGWTISNAYDPVNGVASFYTLIPLGRYNQTYTENPGYQFEYGTAKEVTIIGTITHLRNHEDSRLVIVFRYDGAQSFTISAVGTTDLLLGYIQVPILCYLSTNTQYSTAITAGDRSGNQIGAFSAVFGQGLYAEDNNQVAFGKYNYGSTPGGDPAALTIGDGSDNDHRSNVFTIGTDGTIYLEMPRWNDTNSNVDKQLYQDLSTLGWDDCIFDWDNEED